MKNEVLSDEMQGELRWSCESLSELCALVSHFSIQTLTTFLDR